MEKKITLKDKESYVSPNIEIVEIVTEQNILAGGSGSGDAPNMPGEPW